MYCSKCGYNHEDNARFCPGCGSKRKKRSPLRIIIGLCVLSILTFSGAIIYMFNESEKESAKTEISPVQVTKKKEDDADTQIIRETVAPPAKIAANEKKAMTEIIADSQKKVYTIFADYSQGSGFLMNKKGDVVTNAHVVEGATSITVKDINGKEHTGKIIGYSNTIDVAVIRVPDLAGQHPLALEKSTKAKVGEEVIALGSPLALENTATFGYITGVDRSFWIGSRSYDSIYQTSAAIAPGSSGGPLVSKTTGKVMAINSAKMNGQEAIGFSIPIKSVNSLIQGWIKNPLSEEEINTLFYNDSGELYYQEFWDEEAYFDGGEYSDDDSYDYYDIPDDWYDDSTYEEDDSYYEEEDSSIEDDSYYEEEDSYVEEDSYYENEGDYNHFEEEEDSSADEANPDSSVTPDGGSTGESVPMVEDINGDGVIDINDLTEDINGDGIVDEADLSAAGIQSPESDAMQIVE